MAYFSWALNKFSFNLLYLSKLENETTYDYAFLGLGASNSLLILQLNELGLLKNKTLAIIEPEHKLSNDKTFCFWATPPEVEQMGMSELVDDVLAQ